MNDAKKSKAGNEDELLLLRAVERCNLILLVLLTGGSWILYGWPFAQSVVIGGALVSGSFFWLKRTAMRFAQHAAVSGVESGADGQITGRSFSSGFAVKFATRLFVLAFMLLLLSTQFSMNAIGLIIGLSTVMLSVIIVVLVRGRMIFQENM